MRQLALGVQLRVSYCFDSFHPGANAAAIADMRAAGSAAVWLHGPAGCGKTHLLQAACAEATHLGLTAAYLPLAGEMSLAPEMLGGLENLDRVLLDDIGAVLGQPEWERALFRLYNDLAEHGGRLLLADRLPPAGLQVGLADLASRLAAAATWRLQLLAEAEQGEALVLRAARRGLELPAETLQYLQRRAPRDFAALCALLDELDLEALAAQRRLTVPFVRQVLERDAS